MKRDKPPSHGGFLYKEQLGGRSGFGKSETKYIHKHFFRGTEGRKEPEMAFGPIMRVGVGEFEIELAPLKREDMVSFVSPGMQQATVSRFLTLSYAPVLENEYEWFEKIYQARESLVWGIFDISNDERVVLGTTGVEGITYYKGVSWATSGAQIFRPEYWGKGIASAMHKARTWYVFQHMGLHQIKSEVLQGNTASRKALEKSGYRPTYVERNFKFVDGKLCHSQNMECLNPNEPFWTAWWGEDTPPKAALKARERTLTALEWAKQNVTLL